MAFVVPFRGLRFNPARIENIEDVVTPPYDVVDQKKQAAFKARNPYNMINLDLCKEPGRSELSDSRYEQARELFVSMQEDEVLVRDSQPTLYLYQIVYRLPSGKEFIRKGFISLVRLCEFAENIVKPHEETFGSVTSDRLRLLDETKAQFSQIFSLYSDPEGTVMQTLEKVMGDEPACAVRDADGALHSLWAITEPDALARVQGFFKDKPLYIADGHHRYTTALNLRQTIKERGQQVEPESPYNHTMMYLCPMEDPGLSVLPTHRLVRLPNGDSDSLTVEDLKTSLAQAFVVEEVGSGSREALVDEALARMADLQATATVIGLYHAGEDRCLMLTLKEGAMDKDLGRERAEALRDLDVVVLSDLILEHLLGLSLERSEDENLIGYFSDPDEAVDEAVKKSVDDQEAATLLFLMNNTLVEQVKRVADENLFMPHKSTYFYPKILTGLVLNKLLADEKVGS